MELVIDYKYMFYLSMVVIVTLLFRIYKDR